MAIRVGLGSQPMTTTIEGIDGLKDSVGRQLGQSEWHQVYLKMVVLL